MKQTDIITDEEKNYMKPFFEAKSLAVIGVSANPDKPGGRPLKALLQSGYDGDIYLVNPNYETIKEFKCYPSVLDIPGPVDLAIIVVSAGDTPGALRQCAEKGIKGAVIFTSGFSEVDEEGRQTEEEMAAVARENGMRLMGPNCLGMINNRNGLWASFAQMQRYREHSYRHRFSLISQSGFFGAFVFQVAGQMRLGFDYFASVGNQADLDFTDFMGYMAGATDTKIIAGYIEGLKEGRGPRFMEAAREAHRRDKPVIIMKVGRTEAGAKAASSHTGSLAGEDSIYEAAFRQAGIIRADGLEQLMAVLTVAAAGRWPRGKRAAIISASGGGAVILADKSAQMGLEVVELSPQTRTSLDEVLPFFASSSNPVDVTAQVLTQRDLLHRCLKIVEADPNVDLLMLSFQLGQDLFESVSTQITELYGQLSKPLIVVGHPFGDPAAINEQLGRLRSAGIPVIDANNNGVWAVSALADWMSSYSDPEIKSAEYETDKDENSRKMAAKTLERCGGRNLSEYQSGAVLRAYGVDTPGGLLARSAEEAVAHAKEIGYPVALKIQSPDITHKTDVGGVALNISSGDEVRRICSYMFSTAKTGQDKKIEGILVQEMLEPGHEIIIGMKRDRVFGPVIMFGLGGIHVEIAEDIAFRIAPLSAADALGMIREIRGYKILEGVRGAPRADIDALVEILMKVSRLAVENEEIAEMDINPLFVYPSGKGVTAADALITLRK